MLKTGAKFDLRIIEDICYNGGRLSHLWFSTGSAGRLRAPLPCSGNTADLVSLTVTEL